MENTALITTITGNWTKLLPALKGIDSYVLTTNRTEEFKNHAEEQGWIVKYLTHLEHTTDLTEASIQAKHAKFLIFDVELEYEDEERLINKYDYILYHDHKYFFRGLDQIQNLLNTVEDNFIVLGEEWFSVFEEYFRCMAYERYVNVESKIRDNIDWYIGNRSWEYCTQKQSANMSFLLWNTRKSGLPQFLEDLKSEFFKFHHPECQVLFNLFYYDRKNVIKLVDSSAVFGGLGREILEPYRQGINY